MKCEIVKKKKHNDTIGVATTNHARQIEIYPSYGGWYTFSMKPKEKAKL